MSVLFSLNGQVHGHYTREFITRSLKFNILKDYLLIHIDCTDARTQFRNELFMASRDRLKRGEESGILRKKIANILASGRLKDIYKARKASITVENNDAEKLVRNLAACRTWLTERVEALSWERFSGLTVIDSGWPAIQCQDHARSSPARWWP